MAGTKSATPAFGAFISYKRADEPFAVLLEKALERFTPPRDLNLPQRHLNVFRDREDLTGTEYHAAIRNYLESSARLIVICSPQARSSSYVNDEIKTFLSSRYGEFVLYNPPMTPKTFAVWAAPFVLLALGGVVFWRVLAARTQQPLDEEPFEEEPPP